MTMMITTSWKSCAVCLLLALSGALAQNKAHPFGYCFYSALGLPKDASKEQISKAYNRLTKEYPSEGETKEVNMQIKEAYTVLNMKLTRDAYDKYGMKGFEAWQERGGSSVSSEVAADGTVSDVDEKQVSAGDGKKASKEEEEDDVSISLWGDDPRPKGYCFYAALQLHKKATKEAIDSSYTQLSEEYPSDGEGNSLRIHKKIEEAYGILNDEVLKEVYDKYGMKGYEAWEMGKSPEFTKEPNSAMWGLLKWHAETKGYDLEDLEIPEDAFDDLKDLQDLKEQITDDEAPTEAPTEGVIDELDAPTYRETTASA